VGWVGGPFSHITSLNFVLVSLPVFSGSKRPQQTFFFPFFIFIFPLFCFLVVVGSSSSTPLNPRRSFLDCE
jgi:lipopolysaccharide export LptBFGC system permease protein LptF